MQKLQCSTFFARDLLMCLPQALLQYHKLSLWFINNCKTSVLPRSEHTPTSLWTMVDWGHPWQISVGLGPSLCCTAVLRAELCASLGKWRPFNIRGPRGGRGVSVRSSLNWQPCRPLLLFVSRCLNGGLSVRLPNATQASGQLDPGCLSLTPSQRFHQWHLFSSLETGGGG